MWVRFVPIIEVLRQEIIEKRAIGDVQRFFMDFGNKMPLSSLPANSRLKDSALGAGALLDIGIYPLTYASLILGNFKVGKQHPQITSVTSSLAISNGMDESNVVVLDYPGSDAGSQPSRTAICTSTFRYRSAEDFARIEGSEGEIVIFGPAGSVPMGFRIKSGQQPGFGEADARVERTYNVEKPPGTLGFFWEADAVAFNIADGRLEDPTMPLDESLRMMGLMDQIRRQGGLVYPQDTQ
jgi:dihydrodiol dehydrogenase / D-xylose 1-dehydrogenase (NADP)